MGRNLNLVDVLTAIGQGVIEDIPADPNEVTNDFISNCEHIGIGVSYCNRGVRIIAGPFLWDQALWNYGNWDGAVTQYVAVPQPGYLNAVLADRPYAYWRLSESASCAQGRAIDCAGGVHDGTISGAVQYGVQGALSGDRDAAMGFDATGQIALPNFAGWSQSGTAYNSGLPYNSAIPYNGVLVPYSVATVEFWVRPTTLPSANVALFAAPGAYSIQLSPTGHILVGNEGFGTLTSSTPLPLNTYTYAVAVLNGPSSTLYLNAAQDTTGNVPIPLAATTVKAYIGTEPGAAGFIGDLDEVAIYDRSLPAGRMTAHYATRATEPGKAGEPAGVAVTYSSVTLPNLVWGGTGASSSWAGGGGSRNAWA